MSPTAIDKGRKAPIVWLLGVILAVCHLCPQDIPLVGYVMYPQQAEVYGPVTPRTTNETQQRVYLLYDKTLAVEVGLASGRLLYLAELF